MKSQKFKRVIVVLLVTAIAVAIPGSFAKYMGKTQYRMTIKRVASFFYNTSVSITVETVELPYKGQYAIIVKGGDGADNYVWNSTEKTGNYIQGGIGGTVVGIYTTTEDHQYVRVSAGGAGKMPTQPNGIGTNGEAGSNSLSMLNGGKGGIMEANGKFWDAIIKVAAVTFSKSPSGAGGGAASVVYACDSKGNYNKDTDLLLLAGGGGGAASWNSYYSASAGHKVPVINKNTVASGSGGNGSGNYLGDSIYKSDSSEDFTILTDWRILDGTNFIKEQLNISVIAGSSGKGDNSQKTYGGGGSTTPGTAGAVDTISLLSGGSAQSGTDYSNSGNGGDGFYYAGGGGGGFCGGGGGAGSSISVSAGGGGAGSSAISSAILQNLSDEICSKMIADAKNSKTCHKNGVIPNNNASKGNGYIIIRYLGSTDPNVPVPTGKGTETKSLSDVMNFIVTTCSPNKNKSITNSSSTNDSYYKAVMADPCAKMILNGKVWKITTDGSGNVTIIFSKTSGNSINDGMQFWRYYNGTWSQGEENTKDSGWPLYIKSYDYPTNWNENTTGFLLS